jgi:uncharacterized protein YdaU (DUF1376 family)
LANGTDRPPAFQFYPREFVSSRAVSLMTPEERGGYIMLLCHAWMGDKPGRLPADDAALAILSGLLERWPACRDGIARAFTIRPSFWTQARMVVERVKQKRRKTRAVAGANATNEKRWGARTKVAQRPDSDSLSVALPLPLPLQSAFASASASQKIEPKPSSADADFARFWKEWPNKAHSKAEALVQWRKLKPDVAVCLAAIAAQKAWRAAAPLGAFVEPWKHACRWIKYRCWENETPAWPDAAAFSDIRRGGPQQPDPRKLASLAAARERDDAEHKAKMAKWRREQEELSGG